jgi:KDO2-lipid IV(A) lauroyltransferase
MSQLALKYYPYRALGALAPRVAPGLGHRLAAQAGMVAYYLYPRGAAALRENLHNVLGDRGTQERVKSTALEVFRNLGKNYYDLFHNDGVPNDQAMASITVKGLQHLRDALERGNGVVVASCHFGVFDGLWALAPALDLRITAPAEHLQPEKLYEYICRLRARDWINFVPIDGPLLSLFRALRDGEIVAVAADRDITHSGILVDFFEARARLPDGHVQLALRSGADLLTCFALRQPDDTALLEVEPSLRLERTGDLERDVKSNVPKVVARMEHWISRYPEQWLMLFPIWRDAENVS